MPRLVHRVFSTNGTKLVRTKTNMSLDGLGKIIHSHLQKTMKISCMRIRETYHETCLVVQKKHCIKFQKSPCLHICISRLSIIFQRFVDLSPGTNPPSGLTLTVEVLLHMPQTMFSQPNGNDNAKIIQGYFL